MAIKAFSFTCIRDILMVERLHNQFESIGIEHTMYVDEREVEMFSQKLPCKSRGVHHNGTNGFGRDGMYAKLECIKDMVNSTIEGDTILDCDSDVYFNNLNIPFDMVCKELEYKGFCDTQGYNKDYTHSCNGWLRLAGDDRRLGPRTVPKRVPLEPAPGPWSVVKGRASTV